MNRRVAALGVCRVVVSACCVHASRRSPARRVPASSACPEPSAPGTHSSFSIGSSTIADMSGRGEGAARIAVARQRSTRFLSRPVVLAAVRPFSSATRSTTPGGDMVRRFIPPPTLLWAALGRVALPNLPDTVDSGGRRRSFEPTSEPGRMAPDVSRRHAGARRTRRRWQGSRVGRAHRRVACSLPKRRRASLVAAVDHSSDEVPGFDASIWRFDR